MKLFFSGSILICFLFLASCKSVQLRSGTVGADGTIDMTNPTSMNKDAIRIIGRIEQVNEADSKGTSFDLLVEKIVKYGATFSSLEPKVGDRVTMTAPSDVSFGKGDVILIDILTPRIDTGEKPVKVRMGQP